MPGTADLRSAHAADHGYVWALTVVQLATGFLAVGLVRPWGDRVRGVEVPRWLPIGLGALGGVAVTFLFTVSSVVGLAQGHRPDQGLVHGWALVVMVLCYAPTVLWGPLELAAVVAYARRGPLLLPGDDGEDAPLGRWRVSRRARSHRQAATEP